MKKDIHEKNINSKILWASEKKNLDFGKFQFFFFYEMDKKFTKSLNNEKIPL